MAAEIEGSGIPFTDIHINLTEQTITLKKEEAVVATLVFDGKLPASGVIFFGNNQPGLSDSPFAEEGAIQVSPAAPATGSDAAKEREKPLPCQANSRANPNPAKLTDRANQLPMLILQPMWKENKMPMTT